MNINFVLQSAFYYSESKTVNVLSQISQWVVTGIAVNLSINLKPQKYYYTIFPFSLKPTVYKANTSPKHTVLPPTQHTLLHCNGCVSCI